MILGASTRDGELDPRVLASTVPLMPCRDSWCEQVGPRLHDGSPRSRPTRSWKRYVIQGFLSRVADCRVEAVRDGRFEGNPRVLAGEAPAMLKRLAISIDENSKAQRPADRHAFQMVRLVMCTWSGSRS